MYGVLIVFNSDLSRIIFGPFRMSSYQLLLKKFIHYFLSKLFHFFLRKNLHYGPSQTLELLASLFENCTFYLN